MVPPTSFCRGALTGQKLPGAPARSVTSAVYVQRLFIHAIDGKTAKRLTYISTVHVIQPMSFQSCTADRVIPGFPDLRSGSYGASVLFRVFSGYYA